MELCKNLIFVFLLYWVVAASECQVLLSSSQIIFHFPDPNIPEGYGLVRRLFWISCKINKF